MTLLSVAVFHSDVATLTFRIPNVNDRLVLGQPADYNTAPQAKREMGRCWICRW